MNVTKTSLLSGRTNTIFIEGLTQDMLTAYEGGELIQDALAGIAPEMREFVMTGITPEEWSRHLPEED
tara:strand:+ start:33 stop:236 length:204 start_codon:yes stop_codon:yes gene_type:complete